MPIFNNILAGSSGQGDTGYDIDQSLRANADDGYLTRTFGSVGNRKTWTLSAWVKRGRNDKPIYLLASNYDDTSNLLYIDIRSSHATASKNCTGEVLWRLGSTTSYRISTTQIFRDPSAWYHFVIACDTTQASATDRMKFYVNGEQVTSFSVDERSTITQDSDLAINRADLHYIASWNAGEKGGGYLAEYNFIDGQALTPASFGETNSATNQWVPIEVTGMTYGTNGFYQSYSATELANSFTDSRNFAIESFTSTGANTWTCPSGVTSIDILTVAGGGGGGRNSSEGGGGGGGGLVYNQNYSVTPGVVYDITVGAGGAGTTGSATNGVNGSNSVFNVNAEGSGATITALGGGGGAGYHEGSNGGSGGGGQPGRNGGTATQGDSGGGTGFGNAGAVGYSGGGTDDHGGGGGGAGAAGTAAVTNKAGNGAVGKDYSGTFGTGVGESGFFAGGGGGGTRQQASAIGIGGNGGGGNGQFNNEGNENGTANTGGGGGGGSANDTGGNGGSGIVVLRYISSTGTSGLGHTITANGNVANTRAQSKIGSSAIYVPVNNSNYLSTFAHDYGSDDFTIEFWGKNLDTTVMGFFCSNYSASADHGIYFNDDGSNTTIYSNFSGAAHSDTISSSILDWDSWNHIAVVRDGNDLEIFVNGTSRVSHTVSGSLVGTGTLVFGRNGTDTSDGEGYFDEIRVSNSARYTSAFTPSTTAFTADANTLLLIHSDFDGGLGSDSSGNKNDFSATNLVATDVTGDSPTNNFATWNPLNVPTSSAPTFSEGNLQTVDAAGWGGSSTIEQSSGKWYAEFLVKTYSSTEQHVVGVVNDAAKTADANEYPGKYDSGFGYYGNDGKSVTNGTFSSYGNTYTTGDIIGVALNLDDDELKFYKNNTVQNSGTAISITANKSYAFAVGNASGTPTTTWVANFGQDSSFAGNKTAQGNGGDGEDFYYTPPTGYKALNTDNLPDPAIALPGDHFNTVLYAGNDTSQSISGVGFSPELLWVKLRTSNNSVGSQSHSLQDIVRGAQKQLSSDSTHAEWSESDYVTSFDSDGFSVGASTAVNDSGNNYASWNWKAGGTAVSDSSGDITVSRSTNTDNGISIISYTGNQDPGGTGETIAHGLSQAPEIAFFKNRDGTNDWIVGCTPVGWTQYASFNQTDAFSASNSPFRDTAPTSSYITLGGSHSLNKSANDYICYAFHSVPGFSKVGSYEGNNNADGSFIHLGFKPEFFLTKNVDASEGWEVWDGTRETYNKLSKKISPNTTDAEYTANTTTYAIDFLSNGVKLRTSYSAVNGSNTFLYYVVASSPFKTSNAR